MKDDRLICPNPDCRARFISLHIEGESVQCPKCQREMFRLSQDNHAAVTSAVEWFPTYLNKTIRMAKAGALVAFIRARVRVATDTGN